MEVFNIISGLCSIVGLLVSVFTVSQVIKITQNLNIGNRHDHSEIVNKSRNNTYQGAYAGRDINGIGSGKQE